MLHSNLAIDRLRRITTRVEFMRTCLASLQRAATELNAEQVKIGQVSVSNVIGDAFEISLAVRRFRFTFDVIFNGGSVVSKLVVLQLPTSVMLEKPTTILSEEVDYEGRLNGWQVPGERYDAQLNDRNHALTFLVNFLVFGLGGQITSEEQR